MLAIATWAIRIFPVVVAFCVLVFPAYKGVWLGYVPVGVGLGAALFIYALGKRGLFLRIGDWAGKNVWGEMSLLYGLPALIHTGLILMFRPVPLFDGLFVYCHAVTLSEGGGYDPMTYYPPLMAYWYAGWFKVFGASYLVAQLSQISLSLGVTWTTKRLAMEMTGSRRPGFWAGLAVAWYPSFLVYGLTTPYYHYLYTLLTVGMVWMAYRFWILDFGFWNGGRVVDAEERGLEGGQRSTFNIQHSTLKVQSYGGWSYIFIAGVLGGLGALTKAVQLIAPLQVATWLILCGLLAGGSLSIANQKSKIANYVRRAVTGVLLFCLGMSLVMLPWMIRNYRVFGEVVPVCTSGGLVLYSANNPDSNGLYSEIPDLAEIKTPKDMLMHAAWCKDQAKRFMLEDTGQFLDLAWRKFLHTWGSEATFTELINYRGANFSWIKAGFSFMCLAGWSTLVFLWCVAGFRRLSGMFTTDSFELIAGVLLISNALVYLIFEGGDRHHLPFVPLIMIYAAVTLWPRETSST